MPRNDYRRFTSPSVLKKISRQRLRGFLSRFEPFFSKRGIVLPPDEMPEGEEYDYTSLSHAIAGPDRDSPSDMIEALHLINDMCSEAAHDDMLAVIEEKKLPIIISENSTTAEIALSIWEHSPALLSNLCVEQLYTVQRKFEFFRVEVKSIPPFVIPTDKEKAKMCEALDQIFKQMRRGEGCRILINNEAAANTVRILVQHGQTCKRDGNYINNKPETLLYRPEAFDVIHFAKDTGEIAIHAESKAILKSYLKIFGQHIFKKEDVFKPANKYTLKPLWQNGENSLSVAGIGGGRIDRVKLREVTISWNRKKKDFEVRKSLDLFDSMRQRNLTFSEPKADGVGEIIRAKFDVIFTDHVKPRSLTIVVPGDARYERDEDGDLLESWMVENGFIVEPESSTDEDSNTDVETHGLSDMAVASDGSVGTETSLEAAVGA